MDYFIEKFSAIPEEEWVTGVCENSRGNKCALGHCGVDILDSLNQEAMALTSILRSISPSSIEWEIVVNINDGIGRNHNDITTPKQRILTALQQAKSLQS